ncbi:MAG TPA: quinoprotein relay system zinc metallohydrolase 2 [Acetobacteraceae bacterium]|nr:quinoprotein relay system zinc metallohydrolase 2 [Acetobacteraceae bacterium]
MGHRPHTDAAGNQAATDLEDALDRAMSLTRRGALFGGACLCCLPAATRQASATPPTAMRLSQEAPGIHIRHGVTQDATAGNDDAIANIGCVIGRDAVAVMDPGGSLDDGESLRRAIREITGLPIRYVVMSHVHPDHVFGAAAFLPEHPIFVGHARLPQALALRGAYYRKMLDRILGPDRAGPVVMPTQLVRDSATLDLGNRVLDLTAHPPAHTDCDLSVIDRQTGTLLTGDLLFVNRVPSLDGNLNGWLAQLAAMQSLGSRRAVPGHGPVQVDWPAAAADITRYLTVLLTETRQAIDRNVPISQAAYTVAQSERSRWQLFDAYNPRNVTVAYQQLEWE